MNTEIVELKQALRSLAISSTTTVTVSSLMRDYRNLLGVKLPYASFGFKDPVKFLRDCCTDVFEVSRFPLDPVLTPIIPKNLQRLDKIIKKRHSKGTNTGKWLNVPIADLVAHNTAGSPSISVQRNILKAEVLCLIKKSEGVWCQDIMRLYRETFKRDMKINHLGYTSVISLVNTLVDSVSITRPEDNGDWFLQSVSASTSSESVVALTPPQQEPSEPHADHGEAFPGVALESGIPPNCLQSTECIPEAETSSIDAGDQFEVMFGEVYSPSHFWLIRVGELYNLALKAIMSEMNQYFRGEGASSQLARSAIQVGQYCAAEYDHDWHRSIIISIVDCDTVKVRHVDYGTVESVLMSGLKPLPRCWAELPTQAIRARLASVRPTAAARSWPRPACVWMLQHVFNIRFYAKITGVDTETNIVETFLVYTARSVQKCLAEEIIRAGHADRWRGSALNSGECFLFPTFSALESGATPNHTEILRYLADGIALGDVTSYRQHVPVVSYSNPIPASYDHLFTFSMGEPVASSSSVLQYPAELADYYRMNDRLMEYLLARGLVSAGAGTA